MIRVRLEALAGQRVRDATGAVIGRLEEVIARRQGDVCVVESYVVGASALAERLHAWTLLRPVRWMLGHPVYTSYRVPWQLMDLSNRKALRVTVECARLHRMPARSRNARQ